MVPARCLVNSPLGDGLMGAQRGGPPLLAVVAVSNFFRSLRQVVTCVIVFAVSSAAHCEL